MRGNKIGLETFAAKTSCRAQCFSQCCARYILSGAMAVLVGPINHVIDFICGNAGR